MKTKNEINIGQKGLLYYLKILNEKMFMKDYFNLKSSQWFYTVISIRQYGTYVPAGLLSCRTIIINNIKKIIMLHFTIFVIVLLSSFTYKEFNEIKQEKKISSVFEKNIIYQRQVLIRKQNIHEKKKEKYTQLALYIWYGLREYEVDGIYTIYFEKTEDNSELYRIAIQKGEEQWLEILSCQYDKDKNWYKIAPVYEPLLCHKEGYLDSDSITEITENIEYKIVLSAGNPMNLVVRFIPPPRVSIEEEMWTNQFMEDVHSYTYWIEKKKYILCDRRKNVNILIYYPKPSLSFIEDEDAKKKINQILYDNFFYGYEEDSTKEWRPEWMSQALIERSYSITGCTKEYLSMRIHEGNIFYPNDFTEWERGLTIDIEAADRISLSRILQRKIGFVVTLEELLDTGVFHCIRNNNRNPLETNEITDREWIETYKEYCKSVGLDIEEFDQNNQYYLTETGLGLITAIDGQQILIEADFLDLYYMLDGRISLEDHFNMKWGVVAGLQLISEQMSIKKGQLQEKIKKEKEEKINIYEKYKYRYLMGEKLWGWKNLEKTYQQIALYLWYRLQEYEIQGEFILYFGENKRGQEIVIQRGNEKWFARIHYVYDPVKEWYSIQNQPIEPLFWNWSPEEVFESEVEKTMEEIVYSIEISSEQLPNIIPRMDPPYGAMECDTWIGQGNMKQDSNYILKRRYFYGDKQRDLYRIIYYPVINPESITSEQLQQQINQILYKRFFFGYGLSEEEDFDKREGRWGENERSYIVTKDTDNILSMRIWEYNSFYPYRSNEWEDGLTIDLATGKEISLQEILEREIGREVSLEELIGSGVFHWKWPSGRLDGPTEKDDENNWIQDWLNSYSIIDWGIEEVNEFHNFYLTDTGLGIITSVRNLYTNLEADFDDLREALKAN